MQSVRELDRIQLDGLREVANIGGGHAATALSQLTRRRIMVEVPRTRIVRLEEVGELTGEPDEVIAAVAMHVLGDATGRTVQVFHGSTAERIAELLLKRDDVPFPDGFGEVARSAMKEAGNILVGAYLSALSDFLGIMLLPSVPDLALDYAGAALTSVGIDSARGGEYIFCIDTLFTIDEERLELPGHFLLMFEPISLRTILSALRLE